MIDWSRVEHRGMDADQIDWADDAEPDAYANAQAFLALYGATDDVIADLVDQWHSATPEMYRATDLLRACGYPAVQSKDDQQVKKTAKKMKKGKTIEPPLIVVRDPGVQPLIADGYHRLCAVYEKEAEGELPVRIATWLTGDDGDNDGD